jgi:hypothetical protein
MRRGWRALGIVLGGVLLGATLAQAEVYKCRDAKGKIVLKTEPCVLQVAPPELPPSPPPWQRYLDEGIERAQQEQRAREEALARGSTELVTTAGAVACLTLWWFEEMVSARVDQDRRAQAYLLEQGWCFEPKAGLPASVLPSPRVGWAAPVHVRGGVDAGQ